MFSVNFVQIQIGVAIVFQVSCEFCVLIIVIVIVFFIIFTSFHSVKLGCIRKNSNKYLDFSLICTNFVPRMVMSAAPQPRHKRESGASPEQYPLL